jgi:hypothetical protein
VIVGSNGKVLLMMIVVTMVVDRISMAGQYQTSVMLNGNSIRTVVVSFETLILRDEKLTSLAQGPMT